MNNLDLSLIVEPKAQQFITLELYHPNPNKKHFSENNPYNQYIQDLENVPYWSLRKKSESPVRNQWNVLLDLLQITKNDSSYDAGYISTKDTSGTIRGNSYIFLYNSATTFHFITCTAGVDYKGILVGTGTTSDTMNNYALESKCSHNASGMSYGACTVGSIAYNSGTKVMSVIHSRTITNNGASAVDVTESAFIIETSLGNTLTARYLMFSRDVFTAVNVPPADAIRVRYETTLEFPY